MFYQGLVEGHHSCISFECHWAYTISLEKQPCMAFRHLAEYIFGTAGREWGIQLLWLTVCMASHPNCAGADCFLSSCECHALGIAGEQRATALGMSVQQLNACTSQGKGQRCCEVKSCALKICSPNEQKVPPIIWKEAVKVSFSKDNDRDYSCRELQMFCEKKRTSLKLLSGK